MVQEAQMKRFKDILSLIRESEEIPREPSYEERISFGKGEPLVPDYGHPFPRFYSLPKNKNLGLELRRSYRETGTSLDTKDVDVRATLAHKVLDDHFTDLMGRLPKGLALPSPASRKLVVKRVFEHEYPLHDPEKESKKLPWKRKNVDDRSDFRGRRLTIEFEPFAKPVPGDALHNVRGLRPGLKELTNITGHDWTTAPPWHELQRIMRRQRSEHSPIAYGTSRNPLRLTIHIPHPDINNQWNGYLDSEN